MLIKKCCIFSNIDFIYWLKAFYLFGISPFQLKNIPFTLKLTQGGGRRRGMSRERGGQREKSGLLENYKRKGGKNQKHILMKYLQN